VGSFTSSSKELPDQPVPTVGPEVERLAHVVVDGLIARLAQEPSVPASSLLDKLAGQLEQAAALHRLGLVPRTPNQQRSSSQTPDATLTQGPAHRSSGFSS
jgi:hypothetical protein